MNPIRRHILVPFDGSAPSRRAVDHVAQHAAGSEVTLFHVGPIPPELVEHPGAEDPAEEQELEHRTGERSRRHAQAIAEDIEHNVFADSKKRLQRAGLAVTTKVITSPHPDPAKAIVAEVEGGRYDGVVIGHHERGKVSEWLRSGVARSVQKKLGEARVTIVE